MSAADLITQQHLIYPSSTAAAVKPHWKVKEIGFLNPYLDVSYGAEDLVSVDKDIYYRDVHLFTAQIVNIVRIKDSALVAVNLYTCLHSTVLQ